MLTTWSHIASFDYEGTDPSRCPNAKASLSGIAALIKPKKISYQGRKVGNFFFWKARMRNSIPYKGRKFLCHCVLSRWEALILHSPLNLYEYSCWRDGMGGPLGDLWIMCYTIIYALLCIDKDRGLYIIKHRGKNWKASVQSPVGVQGSLPLACVSNNIKLKSAFHPRPVYVKMITLGVSLCFILVFFP